MTGADVTGVPLTVLVRGLSAVAVVGLLAAIARVDALRLEISPPLVVALVVAAAVWRVCGGGGNGAGSWGDAGAGAALGACVVMVPIAVAQTLGRPWPLFPGDATLLGGMGFLLGPVALAWSLILGCAFSVAYRVCLQRRRGRPLWRGYVPLAPGMTAGAAAVFAAILLGLAPDAGVHRGGDMR